MKHGLTLFSRSCISCLLLASLSTVNLSAQSDAKVIDRIMEIGENDNRTMEHLDVLSNKIGGRLIGSDAYNNAVEWCAHKFEEWGLEVWVQEAGEVPVGFNRGPWFGKMLGGDGMSLHFATPSYSVGTKGVQRGHVLNEPLTRSEFERMKGALKGAWVLIGGESRGFPIDWSEQGDSIRLAVINENIEIEKQNREISRKNRTLKEQGLETQELIPYKYEPALFYKEMVEAGILGIIQSAKVPIAALYDRKNLDKMTFDNLPSVPDIKLDEEQYAVIKKMVDRREYFQLEFDIRNHFKMGPVKYHNVIGVMRGSKYPDEYVIAGGHLDAYDVATGGVDCSNGVSAVMEAARLISEAGGKPKRTILFCLWAGEEFGLYGSKFFVESKTVPLEKISNYFNRDSGPLVPMGITVTQAMYDDFVKVSKPLQDHPDFPFTVELRQGEPGPVPKTAGGSDHAHFLMNGVPTFSFNLKDPLGTNFSYMEIWHTERDLYNKSVPEYQNHASVCNAVILYGIANLDHLLSREGLFKEE